MATRTLKSERGHSALRVGFTLIELLVVIAIIVILATLRLSALDEAKQKAHGIAGAGFPANGHQPQRL